MAYAEEYIIDIPFGAYNPELNTPAEVWYDPPQMFYHQLEIQLLGIMMTEKHILLLVEIVQDDLAGWTTKTLVSPDGIFDSERFLPGDSWSYKFEESGAFSYFCTIHPWMEGIVLVEEAIPDYPHDATGKKIKISTYYNTLLTEPYRSKLNLGSSCNQDS